MASFLAVVDTTIVTIALPSIRRTFGFSPGGAQWVLNAYALVFGGLLLLLGRLGDRIGRRRMFVLGLAVFGAGSVLAGLAGLAGPAEPARDGWLLIAGRFVQGLGGGAFVPASLSLLTATFTERRERSRAVAAYGAMAGLGFVAGMVGGGVITHAWGWRWIFLLNVPVVAVTLIAVRPTLAESRGDRPQGPLDVAGAASVTSGLILLILALTSVPAAGWSSPHVWIPGLLGAAALTAFVVVQRRHPAPLLPPGLVAHVQVVAPNAAVALQSMVGVGWLYLLTLYFQEVRGLDALRSGLLFAPMTLASLAGAVAAGRAVLRFGPRATSTAGLVLVATGVTAMAVAMFRDRGLALLVSGMVVGEGGFMLTSVALTVVATSSLRREHGGLASGLVNTATQLGGGLGLALVATVVAATVSTSDVTASALGAGFLACLVVVAAALLVVTAGVRSSGPTSPAARAGGTVERTPPTALP